MKATQASEVRKWQDVPNIGPAMERDFVALGLKGPSDLRGKDAFVLYKEICKVQQVHLYLNFLKLSPITNTK